MSRQAEPQPHGKIFHQYLRSQPSCRHPGRRRVGSWIGLCIVTAVLGVAANDTHAVNTARWRFDQAKDFEKGERDGLRLTSDGALRPGFRRTGLGEFGKEIWCARIGPNQQIYFGTGSPASVQVVSQNDKVREVYTFGEETVLAVTDLAFDRQGRLYLATLAGGKILRLDPDKPGSAETFCELADHYIWAIRFDDDGRLYVATGPDGKLYRVSPGGEISEYYDTDEANILCLALEPNGILLAGGSDQGRLYRITDRGQGTVLHQFAEQEIKSLLRLGNELYIGVNEQRGGSAAQGGPPVRIAAPKPTQVKPTGKLGDPGGAKPSSAAPQRSSVRLPAPSRPPALHGALYRRGKTGRYDRLMQRPGEALLALTPSAEGGVYAAFAGKGHVYRVFDVDQSELLFDFPEPEVLALADQAGQLWFVGTANTGSAYRIATGPAKDGTFTSQTLDARFPTRWGNLTWRPASGIELATRSGNTREPDDTWSEWSAPARQSPALISSPAARFLQVRARLAAGDEVRLDDLQVFYRVQNQQPHIKRLSIERDDKPNPGKPGQKPKPSGEGTGAAATSTARSESVTAPEATTTRKISWEAKDPDGDQLVYRVAYRSEAGERWVPMPNEKPLTKTSYQWDTESVPDGWYRVRLTASDEDANPEGRELTTEKISDPIPIDNRRPVITDLRFDRRTRAIIGRARDELSVVVRLEVAVDGDDWVALAAHDGIFDEREELFEQELDLAPGPHYLAIRATDEQGNIGVFHLEVNAP